MIVEYTSGTVTRLAAGKQTVFCTLTVLCLAKTIRCLFLNH